MALTKTKFINYIRCPRYCSLDEVKDNQLMTDVSFEEYKEEEKRLIVEEIYQMMVDDKGNSLIDFKNEQLKAMLPYYLEIERLAAKYIKDNFGGLIIPNQQNKKQESFDYVEDGIKYLCYVDIYKETKDAFDIVEVKATTSKTFLNLGPKVKGKLISLFAKNKEGIFCLKEELNSYQFEEEMTLKEYLKHKEKLFNKYHKAGKYIYDLLVQRMIVEGYLKENKQESKINQIKYYLAVLNSDYVFDGRYDKDNKPVYNIDQDGNNIISLFDFTKLTKEMLPLIEKDRSQITSFLKKMDLKPCPLGIHCQHKKDYKCKFLEVCFYKQVPKTNSLFTYLNNNYGFRDEEGLKVSTFELINQGVVQLLDLKEEALTRANNVIQRRVVANDEPYLNKEKIKAGLKTLVYPLYYLDFETFPCPLPRYKGEKCYNQSVFQYSLHIESKPGSCQKDKDNYSFLAISHQDERESLVKSLCEHLKMTSGTVIVYNQTFERSRLKELASLFPNYQKELLKIKDHTFDLLDLIRNKSSLYKELGFDEESSSTINYYHSLLNGSYSIKKVLPLFAPHLDYQLLAITNGSEAFLTYLKFPTFNSAELKKQRINLLNYCQQDTWAMVVILNKLKELVK